MARTTQRIIRCKEEGQPIVALTASDFLFAQMLDQGGVDIILVGDSLAMVTLGYENTLPVTLDDIIHHAKAVFRLKSANEFWVVLTNQTQHLSCLFG